MKSYKQIRADIAKLEREAQVARKSESAAVIVRIKDLAREYDLTAADLGLDAPQTQESKGTPSKSAARKAPEKKIASKTSSRSGAGIAKYRDPKSGRTWTGFGRAPDWLASVKDRDALRIDAGAAQASKESPASDAAQAGPADGRRGAPKPAKKASAKAAVKKAAKKVVQRSESSARPAAAKQRAAEKGAAARNGLAVKKSGRKPARKTAATAVARDQAVTASSAGNEAPATAEAAATPSV